MDGAGLDEEAFGQKEDEDPANEAAKIICSVDAAKIRQLGVDLDFPKLAKSGPCFVELDASVLGCLGARSEYTRTRVCLCFDRCRSKNFELLNQIRVFDSLLLLFSRNFKLGVRWAV